MRRVITLSILFALAALSPAMKTYAQAPQQTRDQAPPEEKPSLDGLQVEKVKDNLYVVKGGGGNTTVLITSKGVVLIDTKNPGWTQFLFQKVRTVTDKPIIMAINTHTHGDHTSGNVELPPGTEIVTQENTKKNMMNMELFKKPENARGLPTKTFKDRLTLFSGADRLELYWFGPTETDGDTWIVIPALRTMMSGDAFPRLLITTLNLGNGGSPLKAPDTLAKAASTIKNVDTIIPGHANVMTFNDLKTFVELRKQFLAWAVAGLKSGKTVDQLTAEWEMPKGPQYQNWEPVDRRRLKRHLTGIQDELNKNSGRS